LKIGRMSLSNVGVSSALAEEIHPKHANTNPGEYMRQRRILSVGSRVNRFVSQAVADWSDDCD
jgi:hypothetical protein